MTTRGTGPADTLEPSSGRGSKMLGGRAVLVSSMSTVLFFAVIALIVVLAPGSEVVAERFFDPFHLRQSLLGTESEPSVAGAFLLNVYIFTISELLILILALVIAVVRGIPGPVFFPFRMVAIAYTDLFRGIPLILVLYIIGFGVPGLRLQGVPTSPVVLGGVALVLTYSAYVAEVFRAGIETVHPSQRMAARSLGLTYGQSMRRVVLPQAVRRVTPPLLNDFVALQKDVGLISVLGAVDAVRAAQIEVARTYDFTPYLVAGFLFILLAVPTVRLADWVNLRAARRQQAAGVL
jgi:polar amino acid transport system permease protein